MRHASHSRLPTSGSYALLNMQWKWHMSGNPAAAPSQGCLLRGTQWRCCRRLIEEGRRPDSQNWHLWHLLHLNPMYSKVPCVWGLITSNAGWRHRIVYLPEDPGNTVVSSGELRPVSPTREDAAAAAAKSLQSCLTLCDAVDGSTSSSPIPGILQARTLEWVAISFSTAWKWKVKVKLLSRVQLSPTPWTAAHQAPLSMGFSRQEYWNGVLLPSPTREDTHHKRISSFYITLAQATWSLDWLDSIAQCATHCKGQE